MDNEQFSIFRTALWNLKNSINSICYAHSNDPQDTADLIPLYSRIQNIEYQFLLGNPEEQKNIALSFCQDILQTIETYGNLHKQDISTLVAPLPQKIRELIITSKSGNTFNNGCRSRRDNLYKKLDKLQTDCFDPTNQINIYQIVIQITKFYRPPIKIPQKELDSIKLISDSFTDMFLLISHSSKVRELENQLKQGISLVKQRKEAELKRNEDLKQEEERKKEKKLKEEEGKRKLAQQTYGADKIIQNKDKIIADLEAKVKQLTKENTQLKEMLSRFLQISDSASCILSNQ